MLIYNFQKEFIGIEEKDLRALGFQDLAGLKAEVLDFADLFVKTPGYIHNFKHVHWIDFITCAESNEESKVIINVNNKNYKCVLQITSAFLMDNPTSKAYLVALQNLRELTQQESERISGDIVERQAPQTTQTPQPIFNTQDDTFEEETLNPTVVEDPYAAPLEIDDFEDEAFDKSLEIEKSVNDEPLNIDESLDVDYEDEIDVDFNDDFEIDTQPEVQPEEEPEEKPKPSPVKTEILHENYDNGYVYDPSVASNELGLPLDLIEEFIQDFIEQSKEFKADLYKALDENDMENLKILSHKLKGVAANLRIEDALEALTIANTSNDIAVVSENLDTFYKIIAKLSGEAITVEKELPTEDEPQQETISPEMDLLDLDFKDDTPIVQDEMPDIKDDEVPQKIDMPELADDTFVSQTETQETAELEDAPLDLLELDTFEDDLLHNDAPQTLEEITTRVDEPIHIDYSKELVANEIGIDAESFNELFNDYIQESKSIITALKDAVSQEDFTQCKKEALTLKGMSDNMKVTSFSKELETLLESKSEMEVSNAINTIESILSQLEIQGV